MVTGRPSSPTINVETLRVVETSHCTETFPPDSMFYFRAAKSFHVKQFSGGCRPYSPVGIALTGSRGVARGAVEAGVTVRPMRIAVELAGPVRSALAGTVPVMGLLLGRNRDGWLLEAAGSGAWQGSPRIRGFAVVARLWCRLE